MIITIGMIMLAMVMSGCGTSKGTTDPSPSVAATPTPAATLTTKPVAEGTYEITTTSNGVKIVGNGVVKTDTFKLPANWYIRKSTYDGPKMGQMAYMQLKLMNTNDLWVDSEKYTAKGTHIWYAGLHYPGTMEDGTTDTFYIQTEAPTTGQWSIEYIAPPEQSSVTTAPYTYNGKGMGFFGPVKVSTRNCKITIDYSGPAKWFDVNFFEQDTNYPEYPSYFINLPTDEDTTNVEGGSIKTSIRRVINMDTMNEFGDIMLMGYIQADPSASWTIKIETA